METLLVTTKVSADGKVTVPVPGNLAGAEVEVRYSIKVKEPSETLDEYGWPLGFWEKIAADPITDPAFKRYPQGEDDPVPSFD